MSTVHAPQQTRKLSSRRKDTTPPAVSAERVQEMLREIAFVLHATRVVRRMSQPADREGRRAVDGLTTP